MTRETPDFVSEVLSFWFDEVGQGRWFAKDGALDAEITERFSLLHAELAGRPAEAALSSPETALACVIVLDQFSRNLYRGEPRAFTTDPLALDIARASVERGLDRALDLFGRLFLYLPFEHSESLDDQDRAVALISDLGDETYTRYAEAHRDVIRSFGRFPHRNDILGRRSTPQEHEYLALPGSGF